MDMIRTRGGAMFTTEKLSEPMRDRIAFAFSKLDARKKIQAKQTYWIVTKMLKYFHAPSAFLLPRYVRQKCWHASPKPWIAPQMTKVQLAPCHNPPITMVMKRFQYVKIFHLD